MQQRHTILYGLSLFALYLVLPYFSLMPSQPIAWSYMISVLGCAWFWGYVVSYQERIPEMPSFHLAERWLGGGVVLCLVGSMLLPYLLDPIGWLGDESFHFLRVMTFNSDLVQWPLAQQIWIGTGVVLYLIWTFLLLRRAVALWKLLILWTLLCCFLSFPLQTLLPIFSKSLARYPPFLPVFQTLFCNTLIKTIYSEWVYRLASFVPMLIVWWILFIWSCRVFSGRIIAPLVMLVFTSLPLLRHHAVFLYIDPILLLGMTLVVYRIYFSEEINSTYLIQLSCWLSLLGFLKVTILPFLIIYWITLCLFCVQEKGFLSWKKILQSFFILFLPVLPQMGLRRVMHIQEIEIFPWQIFDGGVWLGYLTGLGYQFGILFMLLSILGIIWLVWHQPRKWLIIIPGSFLIYWVMMFRVDAIFVGISRYQLYLVPFFFPGFIVFVKNLHIFLDKVSPHFTTWILSGLLLLMGMASWQQPIRQVTEFPNWMSPLGPVIDVCYPVDQGLYFLSDKLDSEKPVLFAGGRYSYHASFYLLKFDLQSLPILQDTKGISFQDALAKCHEKKYQALLYFYSINTPGSLYPGFQRFVLDGYTVDVGLIRS